MLDILQRVRIRITDPNVSDELLNEYIQTIMDRLCLRLGAETLPAAFDSVCVDAGRKWSGVLITKVSLLKA